MTTTAIPTEAGRLIRRYYSYAGIYTLAASIIWGINTLFLLDAGLTISEVFIANSAFSLGTMLFEIPTGVVADTIGRRVSFLLSLGVLAATTLAYVGLAQIEGGLLLFSLVSVLMGLGFTFYSGAMEAWLVDGVRHLGFDGELDPIFARGSMISGAAMLVGTVGGGVLGTIDLALPFVLRSGLLILLFVMAMRGMKDLGFTPRHVPWRQIPAEATKIGRAGITFGWQQKSLRLMMLATAVQMGFFGWAWYAWQPYFLQLLQDEEAVWVAGVVAALLALSMIIGNAVVQIIARYCGRRTTVFLWGSAAFTITMIGVGVADNFWLAVTLLFLAGVSIGVQMPVRSAFFHAVVPSAQRATVLSFDSMISGGGGVVGQTSLGAFSEQRGFSAGYIVGGAVTAAAIPIMWLIRRGKDPADHFAGTSEAAACAPHGLPDVMQVESDIKV